MEPAELAIVWPNDPKFEFKLTRLFFEADAIASRSRFMSSR